MRKSFILPLIAIGGGASYAAGVTELATGPGMDDPSTWRWQVTSILAEQSDGLEAGGAERGRALHTLGSAAGARQFALGFGETHCGI